MHDLKSRSLGTADIVFRVWLQTMEKVLLLITSRLHNCIIWENVPSPAKPITWEA